MLPAQGVGGEFFSALERIDAAMANAVAATPCSHCGGPLHRGNYARKPRGALIAAAGENSRLRYSLCCGRRGCRRRALPPSVRFLGRRVFLEVVVVLAAVFVQVMARMREAVAATGVPARTLRRWGSWWTDVFPTLPAWVQLRALFVPPPPDEAGLPRSLLERIESDLRRDGPNRPSGPNEMLLLLARWLAPITTGSVPDGSRFVAAVAAEGATG